jgi:hypothetical protein
MFGIETVTEVTCTNSNPRRELHGPNPTRAIDISIKFQKPNEFLDVIEPGLRDHHYHNAAVAKSGQTPALAPELMPAPDLRFPKLNRRHQYGASGERVKGYTFVVDYGLGDERSNITLQDCAVPPIHYTTNTEGNTEYEATIQYNGEQLEDDATYGRLSGLATKGKIHVRLLPPAEAVVVKNKGWRSGKADVPPATDTGAPLLERAEGPGDDDHDDDDTGDQHPEGEFAEGSPEQALLDSATKPEPDPLAPTAPRARRGKKVAVPA